MKKLPRVLKQGTAKIRDKKIDMVVLDNKARIIVGGGTTTAAFLGEIPNFIEAYERHASTLALHMEIDANKVIPKVVFEVADGAEAFGYDCTILAEIAEAYQKYRDYLSSQGQVANNDYAEAIGFAEGLTRNLAYVGMTALIDEATGYEKVRSKTDLQDTLKVGLASPTVEPLKWKANSSN